MKPSHTLESQLSLRSPIWHGAPSCGPHSGSMTTVDEGYDKAWSHR